MKQPKISTERVARLQGEIVACHKAVDELDDALTSALKVVSTKEVKETAARIAATTSKGGGQ